MENLTDWITPALLLGLFAWMRLDIRDLRKRIDVQGEKLSAKIDAQAKEQRAENAALRDRIAAQNERMAKIEGLLEGLREAITGKRAA